MGIGAVLKGEMGGEGRDWAPLLTHWASSRSLHRPVGTFTNLKPRQEPIHAKQ